MKIFYSKDKPLDKHHIRKSMSLDCLCIQAVNLLDVQLLNTKCIFLNLIHIHQLLHLLDNDQYMLYMNHINHLQKSDQRLNLDLKLFQLKNPGTIISSNQICIFTNPTYSSFLCPTFLHNWCSINAH